MTMRRTFTTSLRSVEKSIWKLFEHTSWLLTFIPDYLKDKSVLLLYRYLHLDFFFPLQSLHRDIKQAGSVFVSFERERSRHNDTMSTVQFTNLVIGLSFTYFLRGFQRLYSYPPMCSVNMQTWTHLPCITLVTFYSLHLFYQVWKMCPLR